MDEYSYGMLSGSSTLITYCTNALQCSNLITKEKIELGVIYDKLQAQKESKEPLQIKFNDLQLLHKCLNKLRSEKGEEVLYLHNLMMQCRCTPVLPSPPPLVRSPELEARIEKLKLKFAEEEYKKMTQNVSVQKKHGEPIGQELRLIDSQVTFMVNFVLTVVAAFAFGYKAVEYALPVANVSLQLTSGVTLATLVFFADVYFIVKDYV